MTATKFCNVFDEIFLINFCLPLSSFNVVDMINVDMILDNKVVASSENLQANADSSPRNNNDFTSDMLVDTQAEFYENPETVRQYCMDNEDILQLCSQRRRSTFGCNNIVRSNESRSFAYSVGFSSLSPIMKELDNTLFGNDHLCELGSNLDTISSPLWLSIGNQSNDNYDSQGDLNYCMETADMNSNKLNSPLPEGNTRINTCILHNNSSFIPLPLPSTDHDFPELNLFAQLSIRNDREKKLTSGDEIEKKQKINKILQKRNRMKQTTVTFYYDSDEEIKDNSEDSADIQLNSNDYYQSSKYGVRTALGLTKKNNNKHIKNHKNKCHAQYSKQMNNGSISKNSSFNIESSIATLRTHQYDNRNSGSYPSANCSDSNISGSLINPGLQAWIKNVGFY